MLLTLSQFLDCIHNTRAWHLFHAAISYGGQTNYASGYAPKYGYIVGGVEPALIIRPEHLTLDGAAALSQWVEMHDSKNLGSWCNEEDGSFHFDVVSWHDDVRVALIEARKRGQLAIYDVENSKVINA